MGARALPGMGARAFAQQYARARKGRADNKRIATGLPDNSDIPKQRDAIVTNWPPNLAPGRKPCNWRKWRNAAPALATSESCHTRPNAAIWPLTRFHGGNTGSNPVGDANRI